jgi:hypothetical protein
MFAAGVLGTAFALDYASVTAQTVDRAGNIYIGGEFQGSVDFDPRTKRAFVLDGVLPTHDDFLAKYSPNGALLWVRRFGQTDGFTGDGPPSINSLAVQPTSGRLLVAGTFFNSMDFGPTSPQGKAGPSFPLESSAATKGFLLGVNAVTGQTEMAMAISGSKSGHRSYDDIADTVAVDRTGSIYVAGSFGGTPFSAGFLIKLSAKGRFLWQRRFESDTASDEGTSLAITSNGDAYLAGYNDGTTDFYEESGSGRFVLKNHGSFLLKVNSVGAPLWLGSVGTAGLGGVSGASIGPIAVDSKDNVVIAGEFDARADFNFSPRRSLIMKPGGDADGFVAKYAPDSSILWVRSIGRDGDPVDEFGVDEAAQSLVVDSEDQIYVGGYYTGVARFGSDSIELKSSDATRYFLAKLGANGGFKKVWDYGNASPDFLGLAPTGSLFISGALEDTTDVDPGKGIFKLDHYPYGPRAIFVLRLD